MKIIVAAPVLFEYRNQRNETVQNVINHSSNPVILNGEIKNKNHITHI